MRILPGSLRTLCLQTCMTFDEGYVSIPALQRMKKADWELVTGQLGLQRETLSPKKVAAGGGARL